MAATIDGTDASTTDEDRKTDCLVRRLTSITGLGEGGLDPDRRRALAAHGSERLEEMVRQLERAIAHANSERRDPEDGGAERALRRAKVADALDRLNDVGRRIRERREAESDEVTPARPSR